MGTAFHPQLDGQMERQNQTLKTYLQIFASDEQDNWVNLLPLAEFSYNNSIHSITRRTLFLMVYNFEPQLSWEHPTLEDAITVSKKSKIPGLEEWLKLFANRPRRDNEKTQQCHADTEKIL